MTLFVDFNMTEADGRVPALLDADQHGTVKEGSVVIAADDEGTHCRAEVVEISADGRYAMLAPIEGSWDRDSKHSTSIKGPLTS